MLVSSCFPGLKRAGPTRYFFGASNYIPTQDIAIAMGAIAPMPTPYLIPDSDVTAIDPAQLSIRGRDFLKIARNGIYARHGYIFAAPWLREWFSRWAWYHPDPGPVKLDKIEAANVPPIDKLEMRLGQEVGSASAANAKVAP